MNSASEVPPLAFVIAENCLKVIVCMLIGLLVYSAMFLSTVWLDRRLANVSARGACACASVSALYLLFVGHWLERVAG
jgi:hypothetical protein